MSDFGSLAPELPDDALWHQSGRMPVPAGPFPPPPPLRQDAAYQQSIDRWKQIAKDVFFAPSDALKAFNEQPTFMNALGVMPVGGIGKMPTRPPSGIRAYHGSPYDFDRFDLSKIGTGEGAQAYGHGLYFAENPNVAADYKMKLAPKTDMEAVAQTVAQKYGMDWSNMSSYERMSMVDRVAKDPELSAMGTDRFPKGRMYEVNINAKPEQFLDWDRPLNQQSQNVQGPLRGAVKNPNMDWSQTGEQFIRELGHDPQNSALLNSRGIPGIRYLDQGSRQVTQLQKVIDQSISPDRVRLAKQELEQLKPTSNYVLFNDQIIDIMKKWGLVGGMAGAGADDQGFGSLTPPAQHQ